MEKNKNLIVAVIKYLLGYNAVNILKEYVSPVFMPVSFLIYYFSALKMETVCSFKTLVDFQWATDYTG
jgi:hypothetical protein